MSTLPSRSLGFLLMFHLIYTSRARQKFSEVDLKTLLTRSRSNNGRLDVTGMLMYHDGAFLQALEGDELSVRGVFKRIEKDARHAQVTILRNQRSFVERRIFGDWSMGFANTSSTAPVEKKFLDLAVSQDLLTLSETQAIDFLSSCNPTSAIRTRLTSKAAWSPMGQSRRFRRLSAASLR